MKARITAGICGVLMLAACGGGTGTSPEPSFARPLGNQVTVHQDEDRHDHAPAASATTAGTSQAQMQVALVPSELVIGPNRFAVGLLDATGKVIDDADVRFRYFDLSTPGRPQFESEAEATRLMTPDGATAIFAHNRSFDRAGAWGVEVHAQLSATQRAIKRIAFDVLAASPALSVGQSAPALDTPTAASANGQLEQLTSARKPSASLYQVSLAAALENGKPTVVLFATPAFCRTRFCGPAYDVTANLQIRYGSAANFVHVEVYSGLPDPSANNWQIAPAMATFGLATEPWLYLLDASGVVAYRVEGLFTEAEIEAQLQALLAASS
jgi:hypothetical protein